MTPRVPSRALVALLALVLVSCTDAPPRSFDLDDPSAPPAATQGPAHISVSSERPLPSTIAATARALPGVIAVGRRWSGIVNLRAVHGATRALPRRPSDAIIPLSVTALDRALVPTTGQDEVADVLERGEAVVPRSSAEFRGLDVGDVLDLANGTRRARVRVGKIVEDSVSRAELVLPGSVANALSVPGGRGIVVATEADAAGEAERALRRSLGDFPARIRVSGGETTTTAPLPPDVPRQLSFLDMKRTFGEFWYRRGRGIRISIDPVWVERNIVRARLPIFGEVRCNATIVPMLRDALAEVHARGLTPLIDSFDGCYVPRMQSNNSLALSRHAYGIAFDINARTNGYGDPPTLDMRIVEIMERRGFVWGGRWALPDGMHFEYGRFPGTE